MASKPPSNANKLKLRIFATDKKVLKRNLEADSKAATNKSKRPMLKKDVEDNDSEEMGSEEMSDEMTGDDVSSENDDDDDDNQSIGPAIEEPTMYVHGTGSGVDNKCENILWSDAIEQYDDCEVSEAIEEDVFYVYGDGNGYDCDVGNTDNDVKTNESTSASNTDVVNTPVTAPAATILPSKPMFFFGQAGCLKLSPMKSAGNSENASEPSNSTTESVQNECVESEKLENEKNTSEKSQSEETPSSAEVGETKIVHDNNSVALDVNIENVVVTNDTNNDETDRANTLQDETLVANTASNNVQEKIESIETTLAISTSDNDSQTKLAAQDVDENDQKESIEIDANNTNIVQEAEQHTNIEVNECSEQNIESNSSVALETLSVQDKDSEKIEDESPALNEMETIASESIQLSVQQSDSKSEPSDNCDEQTTAPSTSDVLPTESVSLQIEEQSSVAEECASIPDTEQKSMDAVTHSLAPDAPTVGSVDNVPDENETSNQNDTTKNVEIASEQPNEIEATTLTANATDNSESAAEPDYSSHEPVVEEVIVPKKAYICGPETQNTQETSIADSPKENIVEEPQQIEHKADENETTNAIDPSINQNDQMQIEKTEKSPLEQVESNAIETECETAAMEKIPSIETPLEESESSQITPVEATTVLSERIEKQDETQLDELADDPVDIKNVPHAQEIPLEPEENISTETESIPCESTEQIVPVESTIVATSVAVDPIDTDLNKNIENKPVASEPDEFTQSSAVVVHQIENDTQIESANAIENIEPSDTIEQNLESTALEKEDEATISQQKALENDENIQIEATKSVPSPAPIVEKRKSIEQNEEPTECKKVCEEKISIEVQQSQNVEEHMPVEQKSVKENSESSNEPLTSQKLENIVDYRHEQSKNEIHTQSLEPQRNEPVENALTTVNTIEIVAQTKEDQTFENSVENLQEISKIEPSKVSVEPEQKEEIVAATKVPEKQIINDIESKPIDCSESVSQKLDLQPAEKVDLPASTEVKPEAKDEIVKPSEESLQNASKSKEKTQSPSSPQALQLTAHSTRLRNRKRRISVEKVRHSSESDDNNVDALIESPVSQDASSDEQVGGKRIKMRPKGAVRRTTRRSVEQKRNIKDTDWSSDENDKPNAKRATSDVSKAKETVSKQSTKIEKNISEEASKPIAKVADVVVKQAPQETGDFDIESVIKGDVICREEKDDAQQSEEEKGKKNFF